jgi:hypothetical protein
MSILVEFNSREDRLAAIRIFRESDESYYGLPNARMVITRRAVDALKKGGVRFHIVGEQKTGVHHGTNPRP